MSKKKTITSEGRELLPHEIAYTEAMEKLLAKEARFIASVLPEINKSRAQAVVEEP